MGNNDELHQHYGSTIRVIGMKDYHDMGSNPHAIYRKPCVKFEGSSALQSLQSTVQRTSVWIFPGCIWLHLLNLSFHIVEGQAASRCKEPGNSTSPCKQEELSNYS